MKKITLFLSLLVTMLLGLNSCEPTVKMEKVYVYGFGSMHVENFSDMQTIQTYFSNLGLPTSTYISYTGSSEEDCDAQAKAVWESKISSASYDEISELLGSNSTTTFTWCLKGSSSSAPTETVYYGIFTYPAPTE